MVVVGQHAVHAEPSTKQYALYLEGLSLINRGAMTAIMRGDRNCRTSASARGSKVTDQKRADTETKLQNPRSTRNLGLRDIQTIIRMQGDQNLTNCTTGI